jgi:hypothetical protein
MGAVLFEALEAIKTREQLQHCYPAKASGSSCFSEAHTPSYVLHVPFSLIRTKFKIKHLFCIHDSGGDFILFCEKLPNVQFFLEW